LGQLGLFDVETAAMQAGRIQEPTSVGAGTFVGWSMRGGKSTIGRGSRPAHLPFQDADAEIERRTRA